MTDEKVTVSREDITLSEQFGVRDSFRYSWSARFSGRLSTGEYVTMEREHLTDRQSALAALEAAIREQGWEIV